MIKLPYRGLLELIDTPTHNIGIMMDFTEMFKDQCVQQKLVLDNVYYPTQYATCSRLHYINEKHLTDEKRRLQLQKIVKTHQTFQIKDFIEQIHTGGLAYFIPFSYNAQCVQQNIEYIKFKDQFTPNHLDSHYLIKSNVKNLQLMRYTIVDAMKEIKQNEASIAICNIRIKNYQMRLTVLEKQALLQEKIRMQQFTLFKVVLTRIYQNKLLKFRNQWKQEKAKQNRNILVQRRNSQAYMC